jgi:hypothetical protein
MIDYSMKDMSAMLCYSVLLFAEVLRMYCRPALEK